MWIYGDSLLATADPLAAAVATFVVFTETKLLEEGILVEGEASALHA